MYIRTLLTLALLVIPLTTIQAHADALTGKILLQVEANGEAWYVYPQNDQRYFLGRPADAFALMRELGLGITHAELKTYLAGTFPQRLSGMIMLDVEGNGEAYYVNPDNLKGYYLGRPDDAFKIMRELGLGITNNNLDHVTISPTSKVPTIENTSDATPTPDEIVTTEPFSPANAFMSNVEVSVNSNHTITVFSNGLPNHETGTFPNAGNPNTISEQNITRTFTLAPQKTNEFLNAQGYFYGIAVNGIAFDPFTAEFFNNDRSSGWNLDWATNNLGFDMNDAHVQPDGTYHYHGKPDNLLALINGKAQTLIGYAADGFPIYVEALQASYKLKDGTRPDGPGGQYDGTYVEDWEYVAGLGDLDMCNGIFSTTPEYPDGIYHYVITENYPISPRCFAGTPDSSFQKGAGGVPPGGPGQTPPPGTPPPRF